MAIGEVIISSDERYFMALKEADWKTQYLDSEGIVQTRGAFCGRVIYLLKLLMPHCVTAHFTPNLKSAFEAVCHKMRVYSSVTSSMSQGTRQDLLLAVAKKFNEIIFHKNDQQACPAPESSLMLIRSTFLQSLALYGASTTKGSESLGASLYQPGVTMTTLDQ